MGQRKLTEKQFLWETKPWVCFFLEWKSYTISNYLVGNWEISIFQKRFLDDLITINFLQFIQCSSKSAGLKTKPFKLLTFLPFLRWFPICWCDETLNTHQLPSYLSYLVRFRGLKAWVIKNYMPHLGRFSAYFPQGKCWMHFPSYKSISSLWSINI